jgi:CheY-like chemotaxis protein
MTDPPKRVLLVEDDRFLRRAAEAALRQRGFTVLLAADGEEAVRVAQAERPDLILMDLLMPKLTGLEALRILKTGEDTRQIPVVILTNSSREGDMEEAMRLGAVKYLVKANLSLQALGDEAIRLLGGDSHV